MQKPKHRSRLYSKTESRSSGVSSIHRRTRSVTSISTSSIHSSYSRSKNRQRNGHRRSTKSDIFQKTKEIQSLAMKLRRNNVFLTFATKSKTCAAKNELKRKQQDDANETINNGRDPKRRKLQDESEELMQLSKNRERVNTGKDADEIIVRERSNGRFKPNKDNNNEEPLEIFDPTNEEDGYEESLGDETISVDGFYGRPKITRTQEEIWDEAFETQNYVCSDSVQMRDDNGSQIVEMNYIRTETRHRTTNETVDTRNRVRGQRGELDITSNKAKHTDPIEPKSYQNTRQFGDNQQHGYSKDYKLTQKNKINATEPTTNQTKPTETERRHHRDSPKLPKAENQMLFTITDQRVRSDIHKTICWLENLQASQVNKRVTDTDSPRCTTSLRHTPTPTVGKPTSWMNQNKSGGQLEVARWDILNKLTRPMEKLVIDPAYDDENCSIENSIPDSPRIKTWNWHPIQRKLERSKKTKIPATRFRAPRWTNRIAAVPKDATSIERKSSRIENHQRRIIDRNILRERFNGENNNLPHDDGPPRIGNNTPNDQNTGKIHQQANRIQHHIQNIRKASSPYESDTTRVIGINNTVNSTGAIGIDSNVSKAEFQETDTITTKTSCNTMILSKPKLTQTSITVKRTNTTTKTTHSTHFQAYSTSSANTTGEEISKVHKRGLRSLKGKCQKMWETMYGESFRTDDIVPLQTSTIPIHTSPYSAGKTEAYKKRLDSRIHRLWKITYGESTSNTDDCYFKWKKVKKTTSNEPSETKITNDNTNKQETEDTRDDTNEPVDTNDNMNNIKNNLHETSNIALTSKGTEENQNKHLDSRIRNNSNNTFHKTNNTALTSEDTGSNLNEPFLYTRSSHDNTNVSDLMSGDTIHHVKKSLSIKITNENTDKNLHKTNNTALTSEDTGDNINDPLDNRVTKYDNTKNTTLTLDDTGQNESAFTSEDIIDVIKNNLDSRITNDKTKNNALSSEDTEENVNEPLDTRVPHDNTNTPYETTNSELTVESTRDSSNAGFTEKRKDIMLEEGEGKLSKIMDTNTNTLQETMNLDITGDGTGGNLNVGKTQNGKQIMMIGGNRDLTMRDERSKDHGENRDQNVSKSVKRIFGYNVESPASANTDHISSVREMEKVERNANKDVNIQGNRDSRYENKNDFHLRTNTKMKNAGNNNKMVKFRGKASFVRYDFLNRDGEFTESDINKHKGGSYKDVSQNMDTPNDIDKLNILTVQTDVPIIEYIQTDCENEPNNDEEYLTKRDEPTNRNILTVNENVLDIHEEHLFANKEHTGINKNTHTLSETESQSGEHFSVDEKYQVNKNNYAVRANVFNIDDSFSANVRDQQINNLPELLSEDTISPLLILDDAEFRAILNAVGDMELAIEIGDIESGKESIQYEDGSSSADTIQSVSRKPVRDGTGKVTRDRNTKTIPDSKGKSDKTIKKYIKSQSNNSKNKRVQTVTRKQFKGINMKEEGNRTIVKSMESQSSSLTNLTQTAMIKMKTQPYGTRCVMRMDSKMMTILNTLNFEEIASVPRFLGAFTVGRSVSNYCTLYQENHRDRLTITSKNNVENNRAATSYSNQSKCVPIDKPPYHSESMAVNELMQLNELAKDNRVSTYRAVTKENNVIVVNNLIEKHCRIIKEYKELMRIEDNQLAKNSDFDTLSSVNVQEKVTDFTIVVSPTALINSQIVDKVQRLIRIETNLRRTESANCDITRANFQNFIMNLAYSMFLNVHLILRHMVQAEQANQSQVQQTIKPLVRAENTLAPLLGNQMGNLLEKEETMSSLLCNEKGEVMEEEEREEGKATSLHDGHEILITETLFDVEEEAMTMEVEKKKDQAITLVVEQENEEAMTLAIEKKKEEANTLEIEKEKEAITLAIEKEKEEAITLAIEKKKEEAMTWAIAIENEKEEAITLAIEKENEQQDETMTVEIQKGEELISSLLEEEQIMNPLLDTEEEQQPINPLPERQQVINSFVEENNTHSLGYTSSPSTISEEIHSFLTPGTGKMSVLKKVFKKVTCKKSESKKKITKQRLEKIISLRVCIDLRKIYPKTRGILLASWKKTTEIEMLENKYSKDIANEILEDNSRMDKMQQVVPYVEGISRKSQPHKMANSAKNEQKRFEIDWDYISIMVRVKMSKIYPKTRGILLDKSLNKIERINSLKQAKENSESTEKDQVDRRMDSNCQNHKTLEIVSDHQTNSALNNFFESDKEIEVKTITAYSPLTKVADTKILDIVSNIEKDSVESKQLESEDASIDAIFGRYEGAIYELEQRETRPEESKTLDMVSNNIYGNASEKSQQLISANIEGIFGETGESEDNDTNSDYSEQAVSIGKSKTRESETQKESNRILGLNDTALDLRVESSLQDQFVFDGEIQTSESKTQKESDRILELNEDIALDLRVESKIRLAMERVTEPSIIFKRTAYSPLTKVAEPSTTLMRITELPNSQLNKMTESPISFRPTSYSRLTKVTKPLMTLTKVTEHQQMNTEMQKAVQIQHRPPVRRMKTKTPKTSKIQSRSLGNGLMDKQSQAALQTRTNGAIFSREGPVKINQILNPKKGTLSVEESLAFPNQRPQMIIREFPSNIMNEQEMRDFINNERNRSIKYGSTENNQPTVSYQTIEPHNQTFCTRNSESDTQIQDFLCEHRHNPGPYIDLSALNVKSSILRNFRIKDNGTRRHTVSNTELDKQNIQVSNKVLAPQENNNASSIRYETIENGRAMGLPHQSFPSRHYGSADHHVSNIEIPKTNTELPKQNIVLLNKILTGILNQTLTGDEQTELLSRLNELERRWLYRGIREVQAPRDEDAWKGLLPKGPNTMQLERDPSLLILTNPRNVPLSKGTIITAESLETKVQRGLPPVNINAATPSVADPSLQIIANATVPNVPMLRDPRLTPQDPRAKTYIHPKVWPNIPIDPTLFLETPGKVNLTKPIVPTVQLMKSATKFQKDSNNPCGIIRGQYEPFIPDYEEEVASQILNNSKPTVARRKNSNQIPTTNSISGQMAEQEYPLVSSLYDGQIPTQKQTNKLAKYKSNNAMSTNGKSSNNTNISNQISTQNANEITRNNTIQGGNAEILPIHLNGNNGNTSVAEPTVTNRNNTIERNTGTLLIDFKTSNELLSKLPFPTEMDNASDPEQDTLSSQNIEHISKEILVHLIAQNLNQQIETGALPPFPEPFNYQLAIEEYNLYIESVNKFLQNL